MHIRKMNFRAWDDGSKVMHLDVNFIMSGHENNDWVIFKSDKQPLSAGNVLDNPYFQAQIKISQSTDILDMNGKEIFEGDILRDGKGADGVVTYIAPQFVVQSENENFALAEGKIGIKQLEYTQIIGNIYENPELIS